MERFVAATQERTPVDVDSSDRTLGVVIGTAAPFALAVVLVPFRGSMSTVNVALLLVVAVVAGAVMGGRTGGLLAAVMATLSFDFLFTRPYLSLKIQSGDDVETAFILLGVGLIVGTIAARSQRSHDKAERGHDELRAIHEMAELSTHGASPESVIDAATESLTRLLGLRGCWFEPAPFTGPYVRLDRRGSTGGRLVTYIATRNGFELPPDGVQLEVVADDGVIGRFVMLPTPGVGIARTTRLGAVIIVDQVANVLARPSADTRTDHGGNRP